MSSLEDLEERLDSLQQSFIQNQINQVPITEKAELGYNTIPKVNDNSDFIDENDSAICDVAELSDENSTALEELAMMIDDLETRVAALEGKGE